MSVVALLPMKAHSERIINKNVRLLNGRPLFYYIADTLKETGIIERLVINTDGKEISQLAIQRYGDWVEIIDRPGDLIGDEVPMNAIIEHDISILGSEYTYFQTHSTNPFLGVETIKSSIQMYEAGVSSGELDSLFSVNQLKTRLYDENLVPINHDPDVLVRTQDLEPIYEENSNFYIFSSNSFSEKRHRIGARPKVFIMSLNLVEGIDIDEQSDWDLAETILKSNYIF